MPYGKLTKEEQEFYRLNGYLPYSALPPEKQPIYADFYKEMGQYPGSVATLPKPETTQTVKTQMRNVGIPEFDIEKYYEEIGEIDWSKLGIKMPEPTATKELEGYPAEPTITTKQPTLLTTALSSQEVITPEIPPITLSPEEEIELLDYGKTNPQQFIDKIRDLQRSEQTERVTRQILLENFTINEREITELEADKYIDYLFATDEERKQLDDNYRKYQDMLASFKTVFPDNTEDADEELRKALATPEATGAFLTALKSEPPSVARNTLIRYLTLGQATIPIGGIMLDLQGDQGNPIKAWVKPNGDVIVNNEVVGSYNYDTGEFQPPSYPWWKKALSYLSQTQTAKQFQLAMESAAPALKFFSDVIKTPAAGFFVTAKIIQDWDDIKNDYWAILSSNPQSMAYLDLMEDPGSGIGIEDTATIWKGIYGLWQSTLKIYEEHPAPTLKTGLVMPNVPALSTALNLLSMGIIPAGGQELTLGVKGLAEIVTTLPLWVSGSVATRMIKDLGPVAKSSSIWANDARLAIIALKPYAWAEKAMATNLRFGVPVAIKGIPKNIRTRLETAIDKEFMKWQVDNKIPPEVANSAINKFIADQRGGGKFWKEETPKGGGTEPIGGETAEDNFYRALDKAIGAGKYSPEQIAKNTVSEITPKLNELAGKTLKGELANWRNDIVRLTIKYSDFVKGIRDGLAGYLRGDISRNELDVFLTRLIGEVDQERAWLANTPGANRLEYLMGEYGESRGWVTIDESLTDFELLSRQIKDLIKTPNITDRIRGDWEHSLNQAQEFVRTAKQIRTGEIPFRFKPQEGIAEGTGVKPKVEVPVEGVKPPVIEGVGREPPTEGFVAQPGEPSKGLFSNLPSAQETVDVITKPTFWRDIANKPGFKGMFGTLSPSTVANKIGEKFVVARAQLRFTGEQRSIGIFSNLSKLGKQEKIFGKLADNGTIAEGNLKGLTPQYISEHYGKYEKLLTPKQQEWIKTANLIEDEKLTFLRRNGIEVNELSFEEGGHYAGRRVYAKELPDGDVEFAYVGAGPGRPGAKLGVEKNRVFATDIEAINKGYRYLLMDEALYLNTVAAYNRVADKQMADWLLEKIPWRKYGAPQSVIDAAEVARLKYNEAWENLRLETTVGKETGKWGMPNEATRLKAEEAVYEARKAYDEALAARLEASEAGSKLHFGEAMIPSPAFAGKILTGAEAKETASLIGKSLMPHYNSALEIIDQFNALQRLYALAGDASIFTVQLILGISEPKMFVKAAEGFVRSMGSEEWLAKYMSRSENQAILKESVSLLNPTAVTTEAVEALGKQGILHRGPFKIFGAALEPFQRGYTGALTVAGIELRKSLSGLCTTPEAKAAVEDFINAFRGIASSRRLGVSPLWRQTEKAVILTPQYNRAIAALLMQTVKGGVGGKLARKHIAEALAAISAMTVAVSLARGESMDEVVDHLNPTSQNFMTWDVAGQKVGPGSKVRSLLAVLGKIVKDPQSLVTEGFDEAFEHNPAVRFLRSNLSGGASTGLDLIMGKDYVGDPTRDNMLNFTKRVLGENLTPLWIQSLLFEGGDVQQRLIRGTGSFVGMRAYPEPANWRRDELRTELMEKILPDVDIKEFYDLDIEQKQQIYRSPDSGELIKYELESSWGYVSEDYGERNAPNKVWGNELRPVWEEYKTAQLKYGNSAEAKLARLENPEFDKLGQKEIEDGGMGWSEITTPIESLRISVKYRPQDEAYDAFGEQAKKKFPNDAHAAGDEAEKLRLAYLAKPINAKYADDRRRREAYNKGFARGTVDLTAYKNQLVEWYVQWFKIPGGKGEQARQYAFRRKYPIFDKWYVEVLDHEPMKTAEEEDTTPLGKTSSGTYHFPGLK